VAARTDQNRTHLPLYTAEQRRRRDATHWTLVQGILAPAQFLVCLISLALVLRFLVTSEGYTAATVSVLIKTAVLYLIMVTGAIWEKVVFGQYLFAAPFFWEDVVSGVVIALHTAYVAALLTSALSPRGLMLLALVSYAAYIVNAAQFVWKLRQARLQAPIQGAAA
jgi:3-vinyl bacteriochlorophyllide hydratase